MCCRYGKTVVGYSAGIYPDNVSLDLAASYSRQFNSPLVTLVNVGELRSPVPTPHMNTFFEAAIKTDSRKYTYGYMVAAEFDHNNDTDEVRAVAFYNYEAYHTTAISLSLVDNSLLQHFVGANYSIETQNAYRKPVYTVEVAEKVRVKTKLATTESIELMYLIPLMPLITTFYAIYLINERKSGANRLQLISHLHPMTFWVSTILSDLFMLMMPIAGIYLAFFVGDMECFIDGINMPYSFLIFIMFGFASLPLTYLVSLLISRDGNGMSLFLTINLAFGKDRMRVGSPNLCMQSKAAALNGKRALWTNRYMELGGHCDLDEYMKYQRKRRQLYPLHKYSYT